MEPSLRLPDRGEVEEAPHPQAACGPRGHRRLSFTDLLPLALEPRPLWNLLFPCPWRKLPLPARSCESGSRSS